MTPPKSKTVQTAAEEDQKPDLDNEVSPKPVPPVDLADGDKAPEADPVAAEPKEKEYVAVFGGPMIDPDSRVRFTGAPAFAPMTGWLEAQIEAGKIREQESEAPAK